MTVSPTPFPPVRCLFLSGRCGGERCAVCGAEMSEVLAEGCPRQVVVAPSIVWALRITLAVFAVAVGVAAWAWLR